MLITILMSPRRDIDMFIFGALSVNISLKKKSNKFKAENHMTYFGYLYLYSDRTGEKIVHYSLILNVFTCGKCIYIVFGTSK